MSENDNKPASAKPSRSGRNRRTSRELVLKGIYRSFLNHSDLKLIRRELADDPDFDRADEDYFRQLIEGVSDNIADLDQRIAEFIDRPIAELSPIEHAILCISAYELIHDPSIPYRVAINEGVELAKRYGGTDGHKYVNGVLDKLAAQARPHEISRR
ncbi:MAG TPA: transcription antitermination factor NusB [Methylophilaceae bacterium]|nr:transcription antitermination factor NusB [Methylophilaceae bacterium]